MTGNMPGNACSGGTFLEELIDTVLTKISPCTGTGKKNASGLAALKPVFGQKIKIFIGEDCISIPSALTFTDINGLIGTGYIIIMKMCNFRHP
jgi:hypothetical protein